ncbi:MAG: DNA-processing protein DprA [Anaerolineae bacterium]|nr:DNA-protecting protein DprA [Anaerolineae bacterium]MBN8617955.1 DNA-processing protein DprA [Anaerolineae bacterium]
MSDHKYWLGFTLVPEIGSKRLALLLDWFHDLEKAWFATESQLIQSGLERQPLTNFLNLRKTLDLDSEVAKVRRAGAQIVTLEDQSYPALLRKLPDAPPLLYVRGTLEPEDERALAIVGTRKATAYGRDAALYFGKQLAGAGVTIISGLAHGIDTEAHKGALNAGGRTIAVLGCGVDRVYPADNHKLAQEIIQHGAIISEFPINTPPEARNFPRRNRIISGLSLGVLVIEAPEHSGAIITASVAAEQGREVFATPGNIFSPSSGGTNRLIQDGAKLVINVKDVLDELNIAHNNMHITRVAQKIAPTNPTEISILNWLGADPIHIDEIVRLSGLPITTISSTLTILELKGLARESGYMQYCLVPEQL